MGSGASIQAPVVEELAEWCTSRPLEPVAVVAPSWEAALQLSRRVAQRLAGRACVGLFAMPPEALVERIGAPALAEAGVRRLPPWGLEWLAERAARAVGGYYQAVVGRPGFARVLARTVAFLRYHAVPPSRLDEAARQASQDERPRWQALAAIYRAVDASLAPAGPWESEGRWADGAAVWWAAVQAARQGKAPARLGCARLVVWAAPEPFDPGHPWYELLSALGAEASGVDVVPVPLDLAEVRVRAAHTELVMASDEVREAELAVEALLQAAAEGVAFYRMAVVVRGDEGYRQLVADAARRAGLRPYVPGAVRLARTPEGLALLRWLELVEQGLPRAAIMEWLASSPLRPERFGVEASRWQPAAWDKLSARAGVVAGLDAWERRLEAAGPFLRDEPHWPDLEAAGRQLVAMARSFPAEGTWRELAGACRRWVEEAVAPGPGAHRLLERLDRVAELDELIGDGERVPLGRFRQALAALLEAQADSEGRFEQGGPAVLEAEQAWGCSFDTVVVVGLNDPGWPAHRSGARSPLLSEADLEALGLGDAGRRSAWESRRERELFAAAVASAERRLTVSRARAEALTGRLRVDSPYVAWLELQAPGCGRSQARRPAEPLDLPAFYVDQAARLRKAAEAHLATCFPHAARGAAARRARWSARLTPWDGLVRPEEGKPASPLVVPPTALERYARCPRQFFFERRLRVAEAEDPEAAAGLQGRARGSVAHRALQLFFERWRRVAPTLPPGWEQWVAEAVDQAVDENYPAVAALPGVARLQKELLREALLRFVAQELAGLTAEGWQPEAFEVEVEATLALDGGLTVRLPNRLDRVDVRRDPATGQIVAIRVVDYKTSRAAPKPDRLTGGRSLQLPLYLLAAARYGSVPVTACSAELVMLKEDGSAARVPLAGPQWSSLEGDVRLVVETLARLILEGSFPGLPASAEECRRCRFHVVCGPEALHQARRKEGEPQLQAMTELRERFK